MNYKLSLLILFTLFFGSAEAQQSWTLEQCIRYALEHNIQVQQQRINCQQREIDVDNARHQRLPDLNASASENFSFGRGLTAENTYTNTNTTSTSFSLGTSVPLFTGLRIPRTLEQNKLNLQAANADLEKASNDISMQVAAAYVQILYNIELCDVARRQTEIDSLQVVRLNAMVKNGKASGAELARQEATLAQSRLSAVQADNERRLSLLALTQLLELPTPEGFDIVRPKLPAGGVGSSSLPSPDAVFAEALTVQPSIQAEQLRLQSAEKSILIARSALYPTLQFQAGLGSNYYKTRGFMSDGFFRQLRNNFSQYVGLNLSVPIFNRFETRNSIHRAQLDRDNQQLQLSNARKQLYNEIQQAYYKAVNARENYASSTIALRSNEEAYRLTEAKYENGKANITEFNEAKNQLTRAQSDLLRARYEYIYQCAVIDFYRGKPFKI